MFCDPKYYIYQLFSFHNIYKNGKFNAKKKPQSLDQFYILLWISIISLGK